MRAFHRRLVVIGLLAACAGFGCDGQEAASPPSPSSTASGREDATKPASTDDNTKQTRQQRREDLQHPVVQIQTSLGEITITLDGEHAPGTVQNFLNYVSSNHYDNTLFHYVDADSMILGGGFTPDMKAKEFRRAIRNEAHHGLKNTRGTIAMSRAFEAIDSATCQFFINVQDNPNLDHQDETAEKYGYCVFGKITSGMPIVDQIAQRPVDENGTPQEPIIIESIRQIR